MENTKLAPIIFFAYNRPWHTEKTLNALAQNDLADQSTLYIYVDGPKENATIEQIEQIKKVREVVQKKKWCKNVYVIIAEKNITCRKSIIDGISKVLSDHNSIIVIEDDILTSPHFLKYMNNSLRYYESRKSVFSISAHCPPPDKVIIPDDYQYDVYVSPRIFNWGWGTWVDRWNQVNWDKSFIPKFAQENYQIQAFHRGGEDLTRMLLEEYEGKTDVWDVQFSFAHFTNYAVSIVPCISYVKNIGLDGTGTHCGIVINDSTDISKAKKDPKFLEVLYLDSRIMNGIYSYFYPEKRALWKKVINRLSRILGGENIFTIKRKIYC
ncbi:MAG: hypothetical protein ACJA2M_000052 [Polaribacter sp.]|jgi:hypothetical protein